MTWLLATHHRISRRRRDARSLPSDEVVIEESHTDRQSTFRIRTDQPILDPTWNVKPVSLDDLVLAYMSQGRQPQAAESQSLGVLR